MRTAAGRMLEAGEDVFGQVDVVTLARAEPAVLNDPALVAAIRRTNRDNMLHWAGANVRDPGAPVAPNLGPQTLSIARDLVRRGLDQSALDSYRTGQNAAWRLWMALAFELTQDPAELAELLDVSAASIFAFVDETLAGISEQIEREREQLTRGTHAERLEVVTLVLEGAPISAQRAATRLGYALDGHHTAAILFHDGPRPDAAALARAAEAVARAAGARRPLTVAGSTAALWAWVPGEAGPDLDLLRAALEALPGIRAALGTTAAGMGGFRRSHLDALVVQRLLQRVGEEVRLAAYEEVQLVALVTEDEDRARELVERTLGTLSAGPPELRETLRVYLREGSNASATAKALFTHRNTVLNRLARAQAALPRPLAGRGLEVGLALEVVRWLGPR